MTQYFETTVKYEAITEEGLTKNVKEKYLVNAISYTEAEAEIIKRMKDYESDFEVSDIKKTKYAEVFRCGNNGKYYSCQLEFITFDENSGKEKKTKHTVLVEASRLSDALNKLYEGMKGTISDYNAVCVKETGIVEVFDN